MGTVRSLHDVRTMRSVPPRATSGSEQETYLRLSQLASEKDRLERELRTWHRKTERIVLRLREIEEQMDRLQRELSRVEGEGSDPPRGRLWREIELRY